VTPVPVITEPGPQTFVADVPPVTVSWFPVIEPVNVNVEAVAIVGIYALNLSSELTVSK